MSAFSSQMSAFSSQMSAFRQPQTPLLTTASARLIIADSRYVVRGCSSLWSNASRNNGTPTTGESDETLCPVSICSSSIARGSFGSHSPSSVPIANPARSHRFPGEPHSRQPFSGTPRSQGIEQCEVRHPELLGGFRRQTQNCWRRSDWQPTSISATLIMRSCRSQPHPARRWCPVAAAPRLPRFSAARPRPGISLCTSITRRH